jgi:hypothetical protein
MERTGTSRSCPRCPDTRAPGNVFRMPILRHNLRASASAMAVVITDAAVEAEVDLRSGWPLPR